MDRDSFSRVLKAVRRRLRATVEKNPEALPSSAASEQGAFCGALWCAVQGDSEASWWREKALQYSQLFARRAGDIDPAVLGAAFFPLLPVAEVGEVVQRAATRM